VRVALLEADVALPVVKHFIDAVRAKALGEEVVGSLTPEQALVGVVHRELANLMWRGQRRPRSRAQPPRYPDGGLQGSEKPPTSGLKLAKVLIATRRKSRWSPSTCTVPRDRQLKPVAAQAGAEFIASSSTESLLKLPIGPSIRPHPLSRTF